MKARRLPTCRALGIAAGLLTWGSAARAQTAGAPPEGPLVPYQPPSAEPAAPVPATPPAPPAPQAGYESPPAAGAPPYAAPPNLRWVLVDPSAMQPPPEPGFHKHDGFFMRIFQGLSVGRMHGDVATGELRVAGVGFFEDFACGYAIKENLILFGEYSLEIFPDASLSGPGKNPAVVRTLPIVLTFAPGVTYYVEPQNVYVSGALGMAINQADEDSVDTRAAVVKHRSKPGIGGSLVLGKEWWVSANWGLGIAFRVALARTSEIDTDYAWLLYSASALFSATYN